MIDGGAGVGVGFLWVHHRRYNALVRSGEGAFRPALNVNRSCHSMFAHINSHNEGDIIAVSCACLTIEGQFRRSMGVLHDSGVVAIGVGMYIFISTLKITNSGGLENVRKLTV